jgi:hypothetical protein
MHTLSQEDRDFRAAFEACRVLPADFTHRAHLRLAYCYLVAADSERAVAQFRQAIGRFLQYNVVDPDKYSETLTQAWVLAVDHFMHSCGDTVSADAFLSKSPRLLDAKIMLTHYTKDVLFSAAARTRFVEPNLLPIPRHENVRNAPPAT